MTNEAAHVESRVLARAGVAVAALAGGAALMGAATSGLAVGILALASGALLGAVLFIWSSLRILSGDAALVWTAELEDDAPPEASLFARKNRLLRAIRDLETEHALGRLTETDFATAREQYRAELRQVLESSDALLTPHRVAAEHLVDDYRRQQAGRAVEPGGEP